MDILAPFTGTLFMPDKEFLADGSPVLLEDGQSIAAIQWHTFSEKFEVLDATGAMVAVCEPRGFLRRRYPVRMRDGRQVLELTPGSWRTFNGAELLLAGDRRLTVRQLSMWSDRKFEFHSSAGMVGRIMPTTGMFTFRPDSYAFELYLPTMSALEAISLAQALRLVARRARQQHASAGT